MGLMKAQTPLKIEQFDRNTVKVLMDDCRVALESVAQKYGLTLDRKGNTYRRDSLPVMFHFLIQKTDEKGNVLSAAHQEFRKYALLFGLHPDDFGKEVCLNGDWFKISGLKPKSRKFPILGVHMKSGKEFKLPLEGVKMNLKRA